MFHLLYGFVAEAFKKTEYKILLVGPESSGKTTALEQLKTAHAETPGLPNHQIVPTVGLNIARLDAPSGCRLVVWDLGGRVGLRSIWERYYEEAHAVIFCVDLAALEGEAGDQQEQHSSPPREGAEGEGSPLPLRGEGGRGASSSADAAADAYFADAVAALRRVTRSDALRGAPVLILANKSDAVRSPERAARAAEALAHAAFFDDEEGEEEGAGRAALGEAAARAETRAWRVASACAAEGLGLSESLEWLEARVGACERTERLARRAR